MALFKIEKGLAADLAANRPNTTEGWCYFTTDDGKFYIDTTTGTGTANRIALNAEKADEANSADKLKTPRTISLAGGVIGTPTDFNGSKNITIPVNEIKDTYLTWGGKSISGSISPIGVALSAEHSVNQLAFLNPNAITVEYSTDGGSTWVDAEIPDNNKKLFTTIRSAIYIGSNSTITTNNRTRITFTAQDSENHSYFYCRPKKMLLEVTVPGHELTVTIETKSGDSEATWIFRGTYPLSGWSGWNEIPLEFGTFGGGQHQTSQVWQMRLTFAITSVNDNNNKPYVMAIRLFGDNQWNAPSNLARTGHIYSYDVNQNTTFPAKVSATSFSGNLEGNAISADKLKIARTIALTGAVTGSGSFDGSGDLSITTTMGDNNEYLPLTAGENKKLIGPLGLTKDVMYGPTQPETGFEGQLFFVEDNGGLGLPVGGTAGQVLSKNSDADGDASWKNLDYLPLSGGTMTGQIQYTPKRSSWYTGRDNAIIRNTIIEIDESFYNPSWSIKTKDGSWDCGTFSRNNSLYFSYITDDNYNSNQNVKTAEIEFRGSDSSIRANKVYGAVWNDYAEFRELKDGGTIPYGRVVVENGDDTLSLSTKRLQGGGNICSDTYGFGIGETDRAKIPIAVSGRVLAYPAEARELYEPGDAVCTGPNGTVSRMTRNEIKEYPDRIIGYVSAIPTYETWGESNVAVDGRIWIKVK